MPKVKPEELFGVPMETLESLRQIRLEERFRKYHKIALNNAGNEECQHLRGLVKKHLFKKIERDLTPFWKDGDFNITRLKVLSPSIDIESEDKTRNKYDILSYKDIVVLCIFLEIDYETMLEAMEIDAINATIRSFKNIKGEIEDFILKN